MNLPTTAFDLLLNFSQMINQREFQKLLMKTLGRSNKNISSLTDQDDIVACLTDLRTWGLLQIFEAEIENDLSVSNVWLSIKNMSGSEKEGEGLRFDFINHEEEVNYLLSSMTMAQYISVDAPAGYGKTFLLKHLQKRFQTDKKWLCAYVPEEMATDTLNVAKAIAADLNISTSGLTSNASAEILAQFLVRNLISSEQFKPPMSLAILLDITNNLPVEKAKELFDGFVATVQERLVASTAEYRDGVSCQFRVIVAERYATAISDNFSVAEGTVLPFVRKQLTPFDFDVVRLSVRRHWQNKYRSNENDQIAAHLMHYTGGHPGFFAESLSFCNQLHGLTPNTIFETEDWKIWYSDKLQLWFSEVSKSVPNGLIGVFQIIGVYRKLDYHILRALILSNKITGYKSEYILHDKLIGTNLLRWNGRFLQDDVTRRLISIHSREQNWHKEFIEQSRDAEQVYVDALSNQELRGFIQPENWLIEILFQCLQKHVDLIGEVSGRRELSSLFYDEYVPKYLSAIAGGPQDQMHTMWHSIRQAMLEDWEFRFTLNYFLREDQFNGEPLRKLNHRLDALWKND